MDFEFSASLLMAGFFVSSVGYGLFIYGKKQGRPPQLLVGIALMLYPGFVPSALVMLAIGGALVGGMWAAVRAGA